MLLAGLYHPLSPNAHFIIAAPIRCFVGLRAVLRGALIKHHLTVTARQYRSRVDTRSRDHFHKAAMASSVVVKEASIRQASAFHLLSYAAQHAPTHLLTHSTRIGSVLACYPSCTLAFLQPGVVIRPSYTCWCSMQTIDTLHCSIHNNARTAAPAGYRCFHQVCIGCAPASMVCRLCCRERACRADCQHSSCRWAGSCTAHPSCEQQRWHRMDAAT